MYLKTTPERKTSDIVATWGTHLFRCKPPIACASHPTPPPESGLKGVSGQTIVTEFSAKQYRCKDASHVMYIDTMQQPDDFIFEVSNWCKQTNPWTNWHLRLIFARMTKHLRYIHTSITYESGWLWIGAAYCLNFKHPMNPGQLRVFTVFLGKLSQRRVVWSCVQVANLRQEKSANVQGLSQTAGPNRYHQRRAPVARRSNLLPMQARRENIISWIQDWSEY